MGQQHIETVDLARELARLRRRAARQKRRLELGQGAHLGLVRNEDEIAGLTQRLVTGPADDLDILAVKFRARGSKLNAGVAPYRPGQRAD